ncbi:MAG: hypothetical protein JXA10_17975, partial [Anaerolineae bacterium]|nr:hypothetical protein [Anaerolineae bacterium]
PGDHPTSQWATGKLYRDEFTITIPADAPPGDYQIELGWAFWDDGARISPTVTDGRTDVALSEWESLLLAKIIIR